MPLPFRSSDLGPRGQRHLSAQCRPCCLGRSAEMTFVVPGEPPIVDRSDHEQPLLLAKRREDRVRVGLAIHDVNGLGPTTETRLCIVDAPAPSTRFTAVVAGLPLLTGIAFSSRNTVSNARSRRYPMAVSRGRQREMSEEALPRPDKPTKSLPLRIARELELRRVVNDQDSSILGRPTALCPPCGARIASGDTLSLPKNPYAASSSASSSAFGKLASGLSASRSQQTKASIARASPRSASPSSDESAGASNCLRGMPAEDHREIARQDV